MAKFSGATKTAAPRGPLSTTGPAITHEGGSGFAKDSKTALFTLAVTNMVGEPTFYEAAHTRDEQFAKLVRKVAAEDPVWVQNFVPWLRHDANMRSAAIMAAVEYALTGAPNGRQVVANACHRPDEPAEALGYYLSNYGRTLAMAVKRGIADAATRIYDQRNVAKYDGASRGVRMGDVLELTHPKPASPEQANLFRHILDRRHGRFANHSETTAGLKASGLDQLALTYDIDAVHVDERREFLRDSPQLLAEAGYTWERLSGWLPGGMDAEAWASIIPSMGYMALLRNLRNFESVGVPRGTLTSVANRIADPDQVDRSRQFPYRFWSAYRNSGTIFFGPALEAALEHSVVNIPALSGRTLVAIDTSGSMNATVSAHSQIALHEIGAVFAAALSARSAVDLMIYADHGRTIARPRSVLRTVEQVRNLIGSVGHSTHTWPSVLSQYRGHDRIVVFTDMQDHPSRVPGLPDVPVYVWDLCGYRPSNIDLSRRNRALLGGFSDAAFRLMGLLEDGQRAHWPWEHDG